MPVGTIRLQPSESLNRLANDSMTAYGVFPPLPMMVLLAGVATVALAGPATPSPSTAVPTTVAPKRAPRRSLRNLNTCFSPR